MRLSWKGSDSKYILQESLNNTNRIGTKFLCMLDEFVFFVDRCICACGLEDNVALSSSHQCAK